jgi:superfamily II DNA or RNA helicase
VGLGAPDLRRGGGGMTYADFLERKRMIDPPAGMAAIPELHDQLFPFQRDIVTFALRRGRAAVFAGTGLGKSLMELSWADAIHRVTGEDVLILAPLAVATQLKTEAAKFGILATLCKRGEDVHDGINITNYERLDGFNPMRFGAVVLDESSILKSMDGKTKRRLIQTFQQTPYRLAATATPAPNDFMELGNHAEFLGVMSQSEMLSTFFINDQDTTQKWRLKGHAQEEFWKWMASWAVMLRHPEDLGYSDDRYNLPPLRQHEHVVETGIGLASTLTERQRAKKVTISERVAKAADLTPTDRPMVWWCHLNDESEALAAAIPGAVEVRGSDSNAEKERKLAEFNRGEIQVLITKPKICGFGMNWQHCADTGFVGLNDSFEQVYQAIRRFWRFGQERPVSVQFIAADAEGEVLENIRRKEAQADEMAEQMVRHMAHLTAEQLGGMARSVEDYKPTVPMELPAFIRSAD